jgi:hypothetical protein
VRTIYMKSTQFLALVVSSGLFVACVPQNAGQFIAQNENFVGYSKWTLVDVVTGDSEQLKGAHAADVANTTRTIYVKNNADRTDNGRFPTGTILVKTYTDKNKQIVGGVGMVKRGGGFSRGFNDWEYFVLDKDAQKIALNPDGTQNRGAISKCIECHVKAADDYIFTR